MKTICGANCGKCSLQGTCQGCGQTGGRPFGGTCVVASCCQKKGQQSCSDCQVCEYRAQLIKEFRSLGITDMPPLTELYALNGSFMNLAYPLPGGRRIRLWDDRSIYLGSQLPKGGGRFYGLAADDEYLLVSEYGENGADPQILVLKIRK